MTLQKIVRWRIPRRFVSIGLVLSATLVGTVLSPLLFVGALVADAVTSWQRRRFVRLVTMILFYLWNEIFGLTALLVSWLVAGFGWRTHDRWSYRLLGTVHGRWTSNLLWGIQKFLGADINIVNAGCVEPSPVVIFSRHISFLDAVMPSVLLTRSQWNAPRHILMQELRWEPCIDILGHRTPNHFVDRTAGGKTELEAIRRVGRSAEPNGSLVIFPEGGFRTERRFARAVERLRKRQPELAERAAGFKHVLPPRPNGSRAILMGAKDVDVVIIAHAGFEKFDSLARIMKNVPLTQPIEVELKRIPRDQIPMQPKAFHEWLLNQYAWIDAFADVHTAGGEAPTATIAIDDSSPETDQPAIDVRTTDLTSDSEHSLPA